MAPIQDLGLSVTQKVIAERLDVLMQERGVPEATRNAFKNSFEMMYEYIPYAISQREDPSNGKVLAKFLLAKGLKMSKYLGNDSLNCGIAIVELLKSTSTAIEVSSTPAAAYLPVPVLAWGLASLDLLEMGNSCEFAQDAFYHAFLKDSANLIRKRELRLSPVRRMP